MSNYSYDTSLPAYREVKVEQVEKVYKSIQNGNCCLIQIAEDIKLPQSTVSGRVNDLKDLGKVIYDGTVIYNGRKRKRIVIV